VVRGLANDAEGSRFKIYYCARDLSKNLSLDPTISDYLTLLRAVEGEGGEEEEGTPPPAAPLLVQIGSLTATSPRYPWVTEQPTFNLCMH